MEKKKKASATFLWQIYACAMEYSAKQALSYELQQLGRHKDRASIQKAIKLCSIMLVFLEAPTVGQIVWEEPGTVKGLRLGLWPQGDHAVW
jgi:hypothetical protein